MRPHFGSRTFLFLRFSALRLPARAIAFSVKVADPGWIYLVIKIPNEQVIPANQQRAIK
jgi:hypothetical protein